MKLQHFVNFVDSIVMDFSCTEKIVAFFYVNASGNEDESHID